MNENLLPCPFCGGAGEWEYAPRNEETGLGDDGTGLIECQGCKVRVHGRYREEADAKWNTRTHDATLHAPIWWYCDTHGHGNKTSWGCPECVREMRDEIKRLRAALILSVQAMRAPLDDWKGCVERRALDDAALVLSESKRGAV